MACKEGEWLDVDVGKRESVCKVCAANTYSTTGILIDGQMHDFEDSELLEHECLFQDDNLNWISSSLKCTPWAP